MKKKYVAILMATYNGEKFIKEQLNSILKQKKVNVHIYISDDKSTDSTISIIKNYFKKYPKQFKKLFHVEVKWPSKNFLSMIGKIKKHYDYYAFSDQDDLWQDDKLDHAINILNKGYNLYCSRTTLIKDDLESYGYSPLFKHQPSFNNAIVQSIAGGNTMVFDNNLFKILTKNYHYNVISHDWWVYILSTFFGKKVYYDKVSKILYRQHESNHAGSNMGIFAKFKRFLKILKGEYRSWNNLHIKAFKSINKKNAPKENIKTLKKFIYIREKLYFNKFNLNYINQSNIYRQTTFSTFVLKFLFFLKKA